MTERFLAELSTERQPAFVGKRKSYILQTVVGTEPLNLFPLSPTDEYYKQTTVCRETTTYFLHTMEDKQYPLYPLPHPNSTDSQILEVRRETGDAGTPPRYHKDTTDT
jgi:hypothetical protein